MHTGTRAIALAIALLMSAVPTAASGDDGWRWPVGGRSALGYGASYASAGGGTATHGGLDIAGEPGESVRACSAGEVVFAGRVPAGEGAQAYAVTVLTPDGLRVTYLPLRSSSVAKGAHVGAGDRLGALADDGDASSSATHLHLGVRRGEARLDPAAFLAEPGATAAPEPAPAPASAPSPAAAAAPAAGAAAAQAGAPVSAAAAPALGTAPAAAPAAPTVPAPAVRAGAPLTPEEAFRAAGADVASAIRGMAMLRRIGEVSAPSVLDTAAIWSDLRAGRGWLAKALLALAALGVAVACTVPVARSLRTAAEQRAAEPALARRSVQ